MSIVAYRSTGVETTELRWYFNVVRLAIEIAKSPSYCVQSPLTVYRTRFVFFLCGHYVVTMRIYVAFCKLVWACGQWRRLCLYQLEYRVYIHVPVKRPFACFYVTDCVCFIVSVFGGDVITFRGGGGWLIRFTHRGGLLVGRWRRDDWIYVDIVPPSVLTQGSQTMSRYEWVCQ